jgi:activator of HSP90 ATPase
LSSTRRQALIGLATLTAAALTRAQTQSQNQEKSMAAGPTPNLARTSIHYEIDLAAPPSRLYQAILDQKQFTAFSGLPATIDPNPGGTFSMFGGQIEGRNIELVPDVRIVQAWRPAHWPAGIYSIAHFEFKPRAGETTLIFDHSGFPAGDYDSLDSGWNHHYWEPLKKYFAS